MSVENELLELARKRDAATQFTLDELSMDPPHLLLRQLRYYLGRQVDHDRFRDLEEKPIQLVTIRDDLQELASKTLGFTSGSELEFKIRLHHKQGGRFVKQFQFHVDLIQPRSVRMVRIHLDPTDRYDPLSVPRCHLHVDNSRPHLPFPVINPRLILYCVCEHIEPDIGIEADQ